MEQQLLKKYPALDYARYSYLRLRSMGKNREDSVQELYEADEQLCPKYEDRMLHRIAIGDCMAEHREMTASMEEIVDGAVREFLRLHPRMEKTMFRVRDRILQPENFGPAAVYPAWREYSPGWEAGDVFCCPLRGYFPRLFCLEGKYLLIYMVRERAGAAGYNEELVYLSICEENALPENMEQLNALGYLPAFTVYKEYQYLHALRFRQERELTDLKLTKLGTFSGSPRLFRERPDPERNAQIIVPTFVRKDIITLVRAVCASSLHFGPISNAEQANLAKKEWNYGVGYFLAREEAPPSVTMEKTPLGQLGSRTFFRHAVKLPGRVPNKSTMIPDD